jgi:hypothetical protein
MGRLSSFELPVGDRGTVEEIGFVVSSEGSGLAVRVLERGVGSISFRFLIQQSA